MHVKKLLGAFLTLGLGALVIGISNTSFNSFLNNFNSPSQTINNSLAADMGPLRQHPSNSRWFQNTATGDAITLAGSHNWNVLVSTNEISGSNFDYVEYLDFMSERNHNFIRLWVNANSRMYHEADSQFARSGQCCALDGGNKYDLTSYNSSYFTKLENIVREAESRGIYVGVMFFEGWWIDNPDTSVTSERWRAHPYNPENNIHSQTVGTTPDNIHTLSASNFVTNRQKNYITRVINTVDNYDNVIYEIANEDDGGTMEWQEAMADHVRFLSSRPVGITARTVDDNTELFRSSADWISPDHYSAANYRNDPPYNNQGKIVVSDTDHLWGIGGDEVWVWRTFTRGLNPIFMDPYLRSGGVYATFSDWERLRYAMGDVVKYSERIGDMVNVNPRPDLCQTEFCLVDPGNAYLVYSHRDTNFWLDLESGTYEYEWYHIRQRRVRGEGVFELDQGQRQIFDPPSGRVILFIKQRVSDPTPTSVPTNTPTSAPTATVTVAPTSGPTSTPIPGNTATPTNTPSPTPVPVDPPTSDSVGYEAEDALFGDLYGGGTSQVATNHSGYSGSGFVDMSDYPDGRGGFVEWVVDAPSSGDYVLNFRYALTGLSRGIHLRVNNQAIGDYNFDSVGNSWDDWGNKKIRVSLDRGENVISFIATGLVGGPNIDRLEVEGIEVISPPEPTPDPISNTTRYEAEDARFGDPDGGETVFANNHSGYSGRGFVDMSDYPYGQGGYIDWIVDAPSSGNYLLTIGYALPNGNRPLRLVVNRDSLGRLEFPTFGNSWSDWTTYDTTVPLEAGANRIRLRATNRIGGPNIDYIDLKQ